LNDQKKRNKKKSPANILDYPLKKLKVESHKVEREDEENLKLKIKK